MERIWCGKAETKERKERREEKEVKEIEVQNERDRIWQKCICRKLSRAHI